MQSVSLAFAIGADVEPGSTITVYGDGATGVINFDNPLSPRLRCRPRGMTTVGYAAAPYASVPYGGSYGRMGYAQGPYAAHPYGSWQDTVTWTGGSFYGPQNGAAHRFVGVLRDPRGNVVEDEPQEIVVAFNTSPRSAFDLMPLEERGGALVFNLTPPPEVT
jgi:hypothetical protein